MSIEGIGGLVSGIIPSPRETPPETEQATGSQFDLNRWARDSADASLAHIAHDGGSVPERAPAGTDPEAWSLLTGDERAFFEDPALVGPVTYGRRSIDAAMTALGSMLDVRG